MRNLARIFLFLGVVKFASGAVEGFGPWRFGMSKADVTAITKFGPYSDVRSTGGVETWNAVWNGQKTNTSFVFSGGALVKIQIWVYEGKDEEKALDAWVSVAASLQKDFGDVDLNGTPAPSGEGSAKTIRSFMKKALAESARDSVVKVQMGPRTMPPGAVVFSSFFRHPQHGFYVFLYYTKA